MGVGDAAVQHEVVLTNTGTIDVDIADVSVDDTDNFTVSTMWTSNLINPDSSFSVLG